MVGAGCVLVAIAGLGHGSAWGAEEALVYRHFEVAEEAGVITGLTPVPEASPPGWARGVSQARHDWGRGPDRDAPFFAGPSVFVLPPAAGAEEPFYEHNHQPAITWLENGDLLAIWYTTMKEAGAELTVIASRLRAGAENWDPSSEFFKAPRRNMHGSAIFHDSDGTVYHFNGMGPDSGTGWDNLALLLRTSRDNGVTWSAPRAIGPRVKGRHQVIAGTIKTPDGLLVQPCDASPTSEGGTALHISRDGGATWRDPGEGQPAPVFAAGATGRGTIAGIHGGVAELSDGRWIAFGRGDAIEGRLARSISSDSGETWTYSASPFPPIWSGQRLVLYRLSEGPLLLVSFTDFGRLDQERTGLEFTNARGETAMGYGMYAALSYDDGETWPVRKLVTPGGPAQALEGGAWTGTFTMDDHHAEPRGYLAATQTPDGVIHLISSRLHYRFNRKWIETPQP
ncbi:MAG: exo-alpha-sialidase [Candidatus Hydrogenedentes bacterium]|nr:exo-alpha-sialidase [Candidatus Hydrogenedentota bacterium]